jgi:hypothetical protein
VLLLHWLCNGLVMATAPAVAVQSVAVNLAGMAGAANHALRQLGAALGCAVIRLSVHQSPPGREWLRGRSR